MISHDNTSGDASFSFPRYITCKGVVSATCNPKIDELLAQANVAEGEKRTALYREGRKDPLPRGKLDDRRRGAGAADHARPRDRVQPNPLSGIEIRIADIKVLQ